MKRVVHTETVVGKKNLWIIIALVALLGFDVLLLLVKYHSAAIGIFVLLSLRAILGIRDSSVRLTIMHRFTLLSLGVGLIFLGSVFAGLSLGIEEEVLASTIGRLWAGIVFGVLGAGTVTVLLAFSAKAKRIRENGSHLAYVRGTIPGIAKLTYSVICICWALWIL